MRNRKQTSERIAELAARALTDPKSSKRDNALAGSALSQSVPRHTARKRQSRP